MNAFANRTFDELSIGESATLTFGVQADVAVRLAAAAAALDSAAEEAGLTVSAGFEATAFAGAYAGALIAEACATRFPGVGSAVLGHKLDVVRIARPGEAVSLTLTVRRKWADGRRVSLECRAVDPRAQTLFEGSAEITAPAEKFAGRLDHEASPEPHERGRRYRRLLEMAKEHAPLRTAVVHPVDENSILGAVEAHRLGLIRATLVGPEAKIRRAAQAANVDLAGFAIEPTEHSHAAAARAVAMARAGQVEALMKGALHTDELMRAVVDPVAGLRTERRMSHVFAIDAPNYSRSLFITDAAVNIYPDLAQKRDIAQNAIELARALGVLVPRVAILSAVETVSADIRSTLDAAALCKMADRGQIVGGLLDGPLAFDNAVSLEAARTKGIVSKVAGRADILLAPDLEAANMLAKQLEYLADAEMAGIVLGARAPIMLTSRSDKTSARLGSAAIALLFARNKPSSVKAGE